VKWLTPVKPEKNACPASALFQCSLIRSDAASAGQRRRRPPARRRTALVCVALRRCDCLILMRCVFTSFSGATHRARLSCTADLVPVDRLPVGAAAATDHHAGPAVRAALSHAQSTVFPFRRVACNEFDTSGVQHSVFLHASIGRCRFAATAIVQ